MRIVAIGILRKEDLTCNHAASNFSTQTDRLLDTLAREYTWSQIEPALAILCACLATLRPLFTNFNLNLSKYSSRFSRSKSLSSSGASNSLDMNKERTSHLQWPSIRGSHPKDILRPNNKRISTKGGLHHVSIDLGTIDSNAPYEQMSNSGTGDSGNALDQPLPSKSKYRYSPPSMIGVQENVVDRPLPMKMSWVRTRDL